MKLPRPWITRSSRIVVDDRWLRLAADDCVTAEGRSVSPYYVLEAPHFAHIAAVTPDHQLVMVRQYRQGTRAIHLELPAGLIDPTDAHPQDAAVRELREETGYAAQDWRDIAQWHVNPARQNNSQHLFLALGAQRVSEVQLDGAESLVVELVPLKNALQKVLGGAVDSSQNVAAVLRILVELGELKI
jgi:8-oxo-dGTP pyrophosphatase MutT (NUDIX family)